MILYMARSGDRTKVGITRSVEMRTYAYNTHNPEVVIVPKVTDLDEQDVKLLERIVHEILCVTDNEWTSANEEEVDYAIDVAVVCLKRIQVARFEQLVYSIPRIGSPEAMAAATPPKLRPEMRRLALKARNVLLAYAEARGGEG